MQREPREPREPREDLFTKQFSTGRKTYFFDINTNRDDQLYLKVTEQKKSPTGYEKHWVMLFEEDLSEFQNAITETLENFQRLVSEKRNNE